MTVPRDVRVPNTRLRQRRKMRNLTQEGLADALAGVGWHTCSERTIRRYERGETTHLTYEAVRAFEAFFGVPVDQLGFTRPADAPPTAFAATRVPERFYVFDHFRGDEVAMNRRTRACWDWCDHTAGTRCLDEFVAWDNDPRADFQQILREALDACQSRKASLLVFNLDVLDNADVREVIDELKPHELWRLSPTPGAVWTP